MKLGFIGEGSTEKKVLESGNFRRLLNELEIDFVPDVINAEGGGKFTDENVERWANILMDKGASHILILTDKEKATCITSVRQEVDPQNEYIVIVAVKMIEAWFLADSDAMSQILKQNYVCPNPEEVGTFEFIKSEKKRLTGRGVGNKKMLIRRILQSDFDLQKAAAHEQCPSAAYFLKKLKSFSTSTPSE